jgi:HAD superfamily hydrolase (TIGR01484 family)
MHPPVRLVAIDVDGTLLPDIGRALTPRVARALKSAQEAGITVAIATGRRPAFTAPLLAGLGLRADTPLRGHRRLFIAVARGARTLRAAAALRSIGLYL